MMRAHRKAHRLIWPLVTIIVGILFVAALALRPAKANYVLRDSLAIEVAQ
jgi:hypothetical protein